MDTTTRAKQAVLNAGALISGHFIFADGDHAVAKIDMDYLWDHPTQLHTILQLLAQADGLPPADVILGVPAGGQYLAESLSKPEYTGLPIARMERIPGGAKQDFRFMTPADEALAKSAKSVRIYEDVVTTLSSIAGVVRLLDPQTQEIHAQSIWLRGTPKPQYAQGLAGHRYLVTEAMESFPPYRCPIPH